MIALLVAGEVKPRLMPKMIGPKATTATFANLQWHSIEDGLVKKRLYYQDVYPILSNRQEWISLTRGPVSIVFELDYKKGCRRLSTTKSNLHSCRLSTPESERAKAVPTEVVTILQFFVSCSIFFLIKRPRAARKFFR